MPDTPTLREAAEALLQHYEGDEPHPEERRYDRWRRQLNVRLEELAVALAADAAWRARAEAAIALAEADIAYRAADAGLDKVIRDEDYGGYAWKCAENAEDEAASRLDAARRRYEETCRGSN